MHCFCIVFRAERRLRTSGQGYFKWEVLARGALLKLILAFLRVPSCLKLLAASKRAAEDFSQNWSRELDLTKLRSRGGLQSFHNFLEQPRWKGATILRMPHDRNLGLSYRWPNSSISHITNCFPDLQELDLLSLGHGLVKWLEEGSSRSHFSQSFAKLKCLKLEIQEYQQADMLVPLKSLRALTLGCLGCPGVKHF